MRLTAPLQLAGKTATGFSIPESFVESLGGGRHPRVKVTINGYTYRSSIAFMGGEFMLGASTEVRAAAGITTGEILDLEIILDTEPREVEVPEALAQAFLRQPEAKQFFDSLSYSNQRRHVLPIAEAKTEETRLRRVEKSISLFLAGKA